MLIKPRVVQFLTGVSVAALFVVAPVAGKFDAAGRFTITDATATALELPDPPLDCGGDCGPPTGPGEPPTDPVDLLTGPFGPPTDPVDAPTDPVDAPTGPVGPPTDPVDAPTDPVDPPTGPVGPPTDPVIPPTDPVVPPTDPVDPPTGPVELPDGGCEKDSKCVEAKGNASISDDDDVPPIVVVDTESAKEEGLAFVKILRCQTACTASVAEDGDVTVTLTSTTQGGDSIKTKITQDGPDVATTIVVADKIVITAEESFESEDKARDVVAVRTRDVQEVVVLKVSMGLDLVFPEDEEPSQAFVADFANDLSAALGVSARRVQIFSVNEG